VPRWPIPIRTHGVAPVTATAEMARLCGIEFASGCAFRCRAAAGQVADIIVGVLPAKLFEIELARCRCTLGVAPVTAGCNRQICAAQQHHRGREDAQLTRSHFLARI
jgi:hypothetical protein